MKILGISTNRVTKSEPKRAKGNQEEAKSSRK
jgi:hypothetical protein